MPIPLSLQKQADTARQTFYMLLVIMLIGLICGPMFVFHGIHGNRRDRPSMQWPKATGKMMQCDEIYHPGGRHSSGAYSITATYTYTVNNQRYVGHQITLWSPDLRGRTGSFTAMHPVSSAVDVYYNPQDPQSAVLIPGADEWGNRLSIIGGGIVFASAILGAFRLPSKFVRMQQLKARF